MKKFILDYGSMPFMIIFVIGTISIRDFLEYSLGRNEMTIIYFSMLVTGLILAVLYTRIIGIYLLFIGLIFLTLGFSSFPSNQYERAELHYQEFDNSQQSNSINEKISPTVAEYVRRESKARELEFQAAELRFYGPSDYYGFPVYRYVIFFFTIGLTFVYGIFWINHEFNNESPEPLYKKIRYSKQTFINKHNKNQIKIYPTSFTPEVILQRDGVISFKGKSIPNDSVNFFENIIVWINTYVGNPAKNTYVYFDLSNINADSKKYLFQILQKLSYVINKKSAFAIYWFYFREDSEIFEFGEQIASNLDIPITFIKKEYEE